MRGASERAKEGEGLRGKKEKPNILENSEIKDIAHGKKTVLPFARGDSSLYKERSGGGRLER